MRWRDWLRELLLIGTIVLLSAVASTQLMAEPRIEPVVIYDHVSDALRGRPLNDSAEPTRDFLGIGATVTVGKKSRWELDFAHGVQWRETRNPQSGTKITVRWYPRRER